GRSDLLAEAPARQVVGDLLGGDLQAEERVHPREVTAQRGGSRGVYHSGRAARAPQFEGALDVKAADGIAPGAGVLEEVREHSVLGDVGFQAGAVDDEVRGDL